MNNKPVKKGIDISTWQGTIDFNKVKDDGVDFVILREGFGSRSIDKKFLEYARQISQVPELEILGVYHFSYALSVEDAREEAKKAVKHLEMALLPSTTTIFFDLEYDTVKYAAKKGVKIDRELCIAMTRAFCDTVIDLGYPAGVYYNLDYYKNMYDEDTLSRYTRWLADWSGGPNHPCTLQQYTSDGVVNGINGRVDMNYLFDSQEPSSSKNEVKNHRELLELVKAVFDGEFGDGKDRTENLNAIGADSKKVQYEVNRYHKVAVAVVSGSYGNGEDRRIALENKGYDYDLVQHRVNQLTK